MSNSTIQKALDGAEYVKVTRDLGPYPTVIVWHGGTTINAYVPESVNNWCEVDVFTLSDEYGKPEDRQTVIEQIDDWIETKSERLNCEQ